MYSRATVCFSDDRVSNSASVFAHATRPRMINETMSIFIVLADRSCMTASRKISRQFLGQEHATRPPTESFTFYRKFTFFSAQSLFVRDFNGNESIRGLKIDTNKFRGFLFVV